MASSSVISVDIFDKHTGLNSFLQGPNTSDFPIFFDVFGLNEKDDLMEKLL